MHQVAIISVGLLVVAYVVGWFLARRGDSVTDETQGGG